MLHWQQRHIFLCEGLAVFNKQQQMGMHWLSARIACYEGLNKWKLTDIDAGVYHLVAQISMSSSCLCFYYHGKAFAFHKTPSIRCLTLEGEPFQSE